MEGWFRSPSRRVWDIWGGQALAEGFTGLHQDTKQNLVLTSVAEPPSTPLLGHLLFSKRPAEMPTPLSTLPPWHQIRGCTGRLQGFLHLLGICHIPKGFCNVLGLGESRIQCDPNTCSVLGTVDQEGKR